jgi:hypothetical protein
MDLSADFSLEAIHYIDEIHARDIVHTGSSDQGTASWDIW